VSNLASARLHYSGAIQTLGGPGPKQLNNYDANGNRLTTTGTTASTETIATTNNRLSATSGGLVRTYGYAEFERDLLRERVRSGIAAARKRGVVFGRRPGQRVKADRFAPKVLKLVSEGQSYREISHRLGLSKNTVLDIVKRDRAA
jgi:hypothetical protein